MAQPILKRRLNPLLLISTVAALSLLAGVAVLSQDQISKAQQNVSETMSELKSAETEESRLRAEIANLTNRTRSMNEEISTLKGQLNNTKQQLENKTDRINTLESQLDEQRRALNQSDTIQDLNSSLSIICYQQQTPNDVVEDECEQQGHETRVEDES
jgi:septal ring factor EnvC (AmiA/AmiB activator)